MCVCVRVRDYGRTLYKKLHSRQDVYMNAYVTAKDATLSGSTTKKYERIPLISSVGRMVPCQNSRARTIPSSTGI